MGITPIPDAGRVDTLAAGATLSLRLDFQAHSVKVDNPTVQWLYLQDALDGFVPPGQMGCVVPLPGVQEVRAVWQAPPGVTQAAATAGQRATLRAFSFWLPPSPGSCTLFSYGGGIEPSNIVGLQDPSGIQVAGSGTGSGNDNPAGTPTGPSNYSPGLIVSRRASAPADWELANAGVVIDTVPPINSFTQIIAGQLNQRIIILHLFCLSNNGPAVAVFGNFADDSGAVILTRYTQQQVYAIVVHGPVALPIGQGLRVTNSTGVAANSLAAVGIYRLSASGI